MEAYWILAVEKSPRWALAPGAKTIGGPSQERETRPSYRSRHEESGKPSADCLARHEDALEDDLGEVAKKGGLKVVSEMALGLLESAVLRLVAWEHLDGCCPRNGMHHVSSRVWMALVRISLLVWPCSRE